MAERRSKAALASGEPNGNVTTVSPPPPLPEVANGGFPLQPARRDDASRHPSFPVAAGTRIRA